jgi:DNA-binding MarR family transcriptional regulator
MQKRSTQRRKKKPAQPAAPSAAVLAILARFRVIFQTNRQHYQSVQESIGLGGSQLQALAIIAAQPKVGISALAKAMMVRQPTASNLVEQLVRLGLVVRKKSGSDLRAIELTITPKARKVLARAPGPVIGILAEAIDSLRPSAIDSLRKSLDAVLHAMKSRDEDARFRPLADM